MDSGLVDSASHGPRWDPGLPPAGLTVGHVDSDPPGAGGDSIETYPNLEKWESYPLRFLEAILMLLFPSLPCFSPALKRIVFTSLGAMWSFL